MMFDPSITPYKLLAITGWVSATVIVLADLILLPTDALGHLGLLVACGSAILNVRGFVNTLECRERGAFELGRDSVSQMRR